jgi:hypothetical protein
MFFDGEPVGFDGALSPALSQREREFQAAPRGRVEGAGRRVAKAGGVA